MFEARNIILKSPLPPSDDDGSDGLRFCSLKGRDEAGACYRYEVTAVSKNPDLKSEDILGQSVTVQVNGEINERHFHGYVDEFRFGGVTEEGMARYVLVLRPKLWFLSKSTDNRIFQKKSVPDIIEHILDQHGATPYELKLKKSYPPREYCVQYAESDLNFVERLMQHEGIWYFFEFRDGEEKLILVDDNEKLETADGYEIVPYLMNARPAAISEEGISEWHRIDSVVSAGWTHTDYDFTRPSADLVAKDENMFETELADRQRYSYPGYYKEHARGKDLAKVRNIAVQARAKRAEAQAWAQGPASGHRFKLTEHPRDAENADFFILRADYDIWEAQYFSGQGFRGAQDGFEVRWLVQPFDLPYHPPRRARAPVMRGPQTAVVVGPPGEEIYTDEYSRVKVQFHWDREGVEDEHTTCFIRVSSVWAGSGWGFIQVPRIGQEVIVDFLEGDPDQPIITGRVYNAEQMPPYALPSNATQSGWKSNSSPGGGGFNELRFEDAKGNEEVYFQAEKDHNELVKNNESRTIGNDFYESVGNDARQEVMHDRSEYVKNNKDTTVDVNRTVVIGNNDTETVGQNRALTVGSNESISIGQNSSETIGINHTQTVGAMQTISVGAIRVDTVGAAEQRTVGGPQSNDIGASRSVSVGAGQTHSIGSDDSWTVGGGRSIEVGKDLSQSIGKKASYSVGENMTLKVAKKLAIDAGDEILIKTGSASILMKKDGTIQIKGKDIKVEGSGKIDIKASSNIKIKGSKIDQN
ncbi:type VI secretion system Vgr family protein [Ruegeria marina]|uniref:Type VI secretion system secreted protein VgrG n=1 Tax=Ruegeria marina TaxID=639004 RepID=A0A1G7D014_9RHOB|nr:type VI secretion system tip protein TssI/VgrG [Ruegeria marina]SDE44065.1 type VI secretion system secreted protein VgrG [Ruegeria marina]